MSQVVCFAQNPEKIMMKAPLAPEFEIKMVDEKNLKAINKEGSQMNN